MQLTAALFENFTIFDPADWIPAMLELAGLPYPAQRVSAANWGYEILDAPSKKLADVAIHYRDADGEGIIVVEAKKKGGALKPTDGDPASYLDLEAFAWAPRRQLVYLIDESDRAAVAAAVTDSYARSGILSWQQLGGLQNTLAQRLPCGEELRAFVAGAIQHQFLSLDILPSVLCADYLADEPSREEINARHPDKLTAQDWASSEWRLT